MHAAVEKGNIEIAKLLVLNKKLDINYPFKIIFNNYNHIFIEFYFIIFNFKCFNNIKILIIK